MGSPPVVEDLSDGRFAVSYAFASPGNFSIAVTHERSKCHIQGSPFNTAVLSPTPATKSSSAASPAASACSSETNGATASMIPKMSHDKQQIAHSPPDDQVDTKTLHSHNLKKQAFSGKGMEQPVRAKSITMEDFKATLDKLEAVRPIS